MDTKALNNTNYSNNANNTDRLEVKAVPFGSVSLYWHVGATFCHPV